ncbi:4-coumarate--CoA ligase-like 1 isoform X2 [Odontomachus brunneus]|uniref:4-coumarate--CoA ligase-like 1 isoform X2 n=1 Tax=Odontomachus brunneus TaxID=486640 RepID=UPI0013F24CA2|nr:4-coumarate--CoA ligase-like 1 isoform X2 [Odontomachus brunneus]XP_032676364.1 4-coumarate--CoA ligase-like 1 isoform X2 [Odontomachus brunneus]
MEGKEIFPFEIRNNVLIGKNVPVEDKDITTGELILNTLKSQPNFVAQVDATTSKEITFQEIRTKSVRLAIWMTKVISICPKDAVAISSSHYESMYVFLACLYIGAIPVLWPEKFRFEVAANYIFSGNYKAIFIDEVLAYALLDDIVKEKLDKKVIVFDKFPAVFMSYSELELSLDIYDSIMVDNFICTKLDNKSKIDMHLAIILCTRRTHIGSSVRIPHSVFTAAVNQQVFDMLPGDVGMWVGSFSSLTNIIFAVQSIFSFKRTIRFMDYWKQGVCQAIEKHKVNWILLETYMCKEMVNSNVFKKYDLSSLKMLIYTGSSMPYDDYRNLIESLPNTSIISLYYTTETGIISCQVKNGKFGSSGYVGKNICLKIIDLYYRQSLGPYKCGEIICITEDVTSRFDDLNKLYEEIELLAGHTISDRLRTKDVGYYDENGEIFVVGRLADLIFKNSIWYSPTIVENVISRISSVDEVAVVAVKNANNDYPVAYLTTKSKKEISQNEVIHEVRNKLHTYMWLHTTRVVKCMPYGLDGNINRSALRKHAHSYLDFDIFSYSDREN